MEIRKSLSRQGYHLSENLELTLSESGIGQGFLVPSLE